MDEVENIVEKCQIFFKVGPKKLVIFLGVVIFVPMPYSVLLGGGIKPIISSLPDILYASFAFLSYFSSSPGPSLYLFGEAILLLFLAYILACLVYKLLFRINKGNKVHWIHVSIVIVLLLAVYLFADFTNIIYQSA